MILFDLDLHNKYILGGFNFDNDGCSTENALLLSFMLYEHFQSHFLGSAVRISRSLSFVSLQICIIPFLCHSQWVTISYISSKNDHFPVLSSL